ncbi:peptidase [Phycicoccus sp. HDW14]|uniref:cupredoxin domain-containing protein n=1 Tax=Phycicoccus sp. HDW14 TaxID=2714941 RepID=UPI00140C19DF|nr:cupredoxin domain-containing protein [Phycicoccus sp. HDW14]QIM22258.1 peptidase [Phycicoccus sp. HDW14]
MRRTLALTAVAALGLVACGEDEGSVSDGAGAAGSADTALTVTATDDACTLSATTATPGSIAFTVTNSGSKVNEFYVYSGEDIVGEVENIGPGLTRTLTVDDVAAGTYETACKPGMSGDGIRAAFTVR